MTEGPPLETKQLQFNAAMERYERVGAYQAVGKVVSTANVVLQLLLVALAWSHPIGIRAQLLVLLAAWLLADFLNGLVHLYMDDSDRYESLVGPLIAAFHLHHRTPLYRRRNLLLVYFEESGAKIWLVPFLLLSIVAVGTGAAPPALSHLLAYVGVLSSVAEVSHYCCHVLDSPAVRLLRGAGLLLSKKHHARHHRDDNVNYAFLSGISDPLLNVIARRWSRGYKGTTDRHYATYVGAGTANR